MEGEITTSLLMTLGVGTVIEIVLLLIIAVEIGLVYVKMERTKKEK